jgi:hypothetical protein
MRLLPAAVFAVLVFPAAETAEAARARFHYTPADANGAMRLDPAGSATSRFPFFGGDTPAAAVPPRPTVSLTYRHPYSGRYVTVPLALPAGTPRVEYRGQRVIYNYGSYTVEVHFLADGSVDVVYNSGLLRAL